MEVKPGYKQTEVGVIPEEWLTSSLLAVADCLDNLRVPLNDAQRQRRQGDFPYCGANGVLDYVNDFVVDDDIILMAEDGGYFDEYASRPIAYRMQGKCWVNNHAHILKAKRGHDQGFLFYSLVHKNILPFLASGTRAKLNKSEMEKIVVPVPPSEAEQRAIAEALSDVDELLGGLDRLIAKKRDLKQAAMQQLLTGLTRLPGFHGEWEVKPLGKVLRFQVGFPFSSAFFNEKEQGVRLVKNRDLKSDDQVFHYSGGYDSAFLVKNGDVLVGMDGDFLPCLWSKGTALLNQRVGRIAPLAGLNLQFAYYYLLEPLKEIEISTASTTVKHLSHGDIEGIEKPLPLEPEQTAIAEVLTVMDAELAALEQRREKTRALKQAMMQELLTGRIRLVGRN